MWHLAWVLGMDSSPPWCKCAVCNHFRLGREWDMHSARRKCSEVQRVRAARPPLNWKPERAPRLSSVAGSQDSCSGQGSSPGSRTSTIETPQQEFLEELICSALQKETVIRATEEDEPLFRPLFFMAPKKNGTWRQILNLWPLNATHVRPQRLLMETLTFIIPTLKGGMWAASLDPKDASHLIVPIFRGLQEPREMVSPPLQVLHLPKGLHLSLFFLCLCPRDLGDLGGLYAMVSVWVLISIILLLEFKPIEAELGHRGCGVRCSGECLAS